MNLSGGKNGASQIELNPVNGDLVLNGNLYNDNSKGYVINGNTGKTLTLNTALGVGGTAADVSFEVAENSNVDIKVAQIYGGGTTVSAGKLLVNNTSGSGTGTGSVSVKSGATLGGSGTIGGATTIAGTHDVGGGANRTQNFSSSLTYNTASIFNWDLDADAADTGEENQGTYDQVIAVGAVTKGAGTGSVFNIVLGTNSFTNAFWDTAKSWTNIFSSGSGSDSLATIFTSFGGNVPASGLVADQGQFAFSGNTLSWAAVPEPTSALAGVLLGAGLLRRRRGSAASRS